MLHYTEAGGGPALMFVHAFPLDHTMWLPQVDLFAKNYRVITPDIYGFGSSRPAIPWTMNEAGAELNSLLDQLRIEECILVGLSMGGYIGLPFAANYPKRVEKLVLASTRARADTEAEKTARTEMISAVQKDGVRILPERMLPRLLGPTPPAGVREQVRRTIEAADANAVIAAVTAMRDRPDATDLLAGLSCPTLVIAGDVDAIMKIEDLRKMADAVPGGRFAAIANAGHLSNLENPVAFNTALQDFLQA